MCANVSPCPLQGKGRKRGFEIIRTPDREGSSFLVNNVLVRYVGTCPETGISFYCNNGEGGVVGVRVYPNGRRVNENASGVNQGKPYAHSNAEYLQFKTAFGYHKSILVSHAVWMAAGRTIPAGMTLDHIDGCTTNNYIGNLRCIDRNTNSRDGGFLRILRHKGFNPGTSSRQTGGVASAEKGMCIPRWMLLRYYDRMAQLKPAISKYRYKRLTRDQLNHILYDPEFTLPV